MNWNKLTNSNQIEEIRSLSMERPVLIFKHSTRCSISSMSLDRLLRNWKDEDEDKVVPYFLDLIAYRQLSDQIESEFGVVHQSPQVILIKEGKAVYEDSHFRISYSNIMKQV
ncbi:bacillithiol system redox-active protein YtxJ [Algoriphagus hitonicola]|uniref:Bacillithiol system protein YtxJ n=1 Tax=Algoriphagus hitonicola TaxID=435880 RepID=A0A1I2QIJ3_9BACT|nr:bacillithiol system redox-active protein YtxJ [Algoriphagus hitonicola]SFG27790.1 bacillithiol system protein YtxJ [Algoriphagus hitonicola]